MSSRRKFIKTAAAAGIAVAATGYSTTTAKAGSALVMTPEKQQELTPDQSLEILKEGNKRFVNGKGLNTDLLGQVRQFKKGQFPFAAVITCLDSRTQPEYIFDLGIGDIFCGRIAAPCLAALVIAHLPLCLWLGGRGQSAAS